MSEIVLKIHPELPLKNDWRIGCIGSGFIMSDCHIPSYLKAGFKPVAVCSENLQNAQKLANRHGVKKVYSNAIELIDDESIEVLDIAVPPQKQLGIIQEAVKRPHIKGILAQKPLGVNYQEALEIVELCEAHGKLLTVNQNMRYDHSIRALKQLMVNGVLGQQILGTIDMRAVPHWAPWQASLGWLTLRMMSIHHLDVSRFLFGDPSRVYCTFTQDPRTSFAHEDGICLTTLEYDNGARFQITDDVWAGPTKEGSASDCYVKWRMEGCKGLAKGEIGWPMWPVITPSTITYSTIKSNGQWTSPKWQEAWFPDAFLGPMAELLRGLEGSVVNLNGKDNLKTMLLVEACYQSGSNKQIIDFNKICKENKQ